MRSNACARSPSSSLPVSVTGSSKRPPAIRSAARSSRRIRFACTDAAEIADDDGEEEPDQTREQEPPLDQLQARDRVCQRVAEQDHDTLVLERNRHLGEAAAATLGRAALDRARARRQPRGRIPGDVERRRRVRVAEDEGLLLEDRVDDDPSLEDRRRLLGELLVADALIFAAAIDARDVARVLFEPVELRVDQLRLERRDDDQIDDAERAGDDDEKRQRQAEADAAKPRTAPDGHSALPEAVADPPHGEDQLRLVRILLDLLPQVPDVDVDRPRLAIVGAATQALEQLAA